MLLILKSFADELVCDCLKRQKSYIVDPAPNPPPDHHQTTPSHHHSFPSTSSLLHYFHSQLYIYPTAVCIFLLFWAFSLARGVFICRSRCCCLWPSSVVCNRHSISLDVRLPVFAFANIHQITDFLTPLTFRPPPPPTIKGDNEARWR